MVRKVWDKESPQQWGDHEWPTGPDPRSTRETSPCTRCNGEGRVTKLFSSATKVCPCCKGSGAED